MTAHVFEKGETIVHPRHGAAIVEDRLTLEIAGEEREYLKIHVARANLTLSVPVESADEIGLRQIMSKQQIGKVLQVLEQGKSDSSDNWTRRYKDNQVKLSSGDMFQLAEVLRDLSIRQRQKSLSDAEKRMLAKAREILSSELMLVNETTEEEAETEVDRILDEAFAARASTES